MKKCFWGIFIVIMAIAACTSKPAVGSGTTLDKALLEAADRIDEMLARGTKIAMINFTSPSNQFSLYVLDELSANLVDTRHLTVIDRQEIDLRRAELNFQMSGEVSDESMQALGKTLGAQSIVTGSLREIGDAYRIMIRVLNVKSAAVEVQYRTDIINDRRVASLLSGSAGFMGGTGKGPSVKPQNYSLEVTSLFAGKLYFQNKEVAELSPNETFTIPLEKSGTYSLRMVVGDGLKASSSIKSVTVTSKGTTKVNFTYYVRGLGPGGGYVFFDKGDDSGGWQFLEAAPATFEFRAQYNGAVMQADSLVVNGLVGWRIPDKDELNRIFTMLKQNGLGGFRNEYYWSSTKSQWSDGVFARRFSDGAEHHQVSLDGSHDRGNNYYIRAIRQF